MKTYFLIAALLLSALSSFSQNWFYSPVNNGRDVNAIKIFSPDTVIVAGGWKFNNNDTSSALFLSHNGGLYLWNVPQFPDIDNWLTSVDFTDTQNGIAVGNGGAIVKTTDGGWNWTSSANAPLNRDLNKIYLIDAQNMIIVGGEEGDSSQARRHTILKSTDGGQSWNIVLDQPGQWLKSVYFPTPSVGFAVGDSGTIFKTTNGGANWAGITAPIQRNFNAIWFTDASNGFIVGGYPENDSIQTILQTTDGGQNWTIKRDLVASMLRDVHFTNSTLGYAVGDDATVLKTTDGGQTWNALTIPGTVGDEQFNAVRFYSADFGYVSGKWGAQYIYNEEPAPDVFASAAIFIDSNDVVLNGLVNPKNELAAVKFFFGEKDNPTPYEQAYGDIVKNSTFTPVQFSAVNLLPDTSYYFFIKAWTLGGIVYSDTLTFSTDAINAVVKTLDATNVTLTSAQFNGSIKGYSTPVNLFFEYGTTPGFGTQLAATPSSVNDTTLRTVMATINTLQPYTLYYYRLKAVDGANTFYGNTNFFFTGANEFFTGLTTLAATSITDTSAILNGFANGFKVPATLTFEYSENFPSFHQATPFTTTINDSLAHTFSTQITGLTANVIHYFRLKAATPLGIFYGDTLAFYTLSQNPNVQTLAATNITNTDVQFNGLLQNLTQQISTVSFDYGTTLLLGNNVAATPASVNDSLPHPVEATLTGLTPNTIYFYRLKAETPQGTIFYGETKQAYVGTPTIPNWDFQNWTDKTVEITKDWLLVGENFQRVAGNGGGSALQIGAPGIITLGLFGGFSGNGINFTRHVPFNYRPDSIVFYANCTLAASDTSMMFVLMKDKETDTTIAGQACKITNTGGVFKRFAFAFQYMSSAIPDSIGILMAVGTAGTSVTIDNITFKAASGTPALPNGDFEGWFDYSFADLDEWQALNLIAFDTTAASVANPVSRTYFNYPDDYAAEVRCVPNPAGGFMPGAIGTTLGILGSPQPSFAVTEQHKTLNGYYQYYPQNGDSLVLNIFMFENGQNIGQGYLVIGETVSEFQTFEIPINYYTDTSGTTFTPDSGIIAISAMKDGPLGESRLIIDKLSFDGFHGSLEDVAVPPVSAVQEKLLLYPNPATASITIQLGIQQTENLQLEIYNMQGKQIFATPFSGKSMEIKTTDFPSGMYVVQLANNEKKITSRFILMR